MNTLFLLLQTTTKGGGTAWGQLLPLFLILLVFYFFFIMPQTKKNKAQKKFRESLQKGDKVLTIGGIHGKVTEVKEKTVVLEIAQNIKITIEKSALSINGESVVQK